MKERILAVLIGSALAGLVSGCDIHQFRVNTRNAIDALMGRVPQSQMNAPTQKEVTTEAQKKLYESSQLLHEMFQVVLLREPYGPEEFGIYVNTLSQGGSLEGIYNGMVNSEQYHKLENTPAPAYPATVKVFAKLISPLQKELLKTAFRPTDLGVNAPFDSTQYEKLYAKASFYELKRFLGNEAMKVVEAKLGKGDSRAELAQWYSDWVAQVAQVAQTMAQNVDFGIPLRNRADSAFHHDWVMSLKSDMVSDRVNWEVLNRVHRVLNFVEVNASQKK